MYIRCISHTYLTHSPRMVHAYSCIFHGCPMHIPCICNEYSMHIPYIFRFRAHSMHIQYISHAYSINEPSHWAQGRKKTFEAIQSAYSPHTFRVVRGSVLAVWRPRANFGKILGILGSVDSVREGSGKVYIFHA